MNELSNEVIRISTDGFDTARDELRQTQRALDVFAGAAEKSGNWVTKAVFDAMDRDFGQGARAAKKHAEEAAKAHAAGAASVVASQAKAAAAVKAAAALRPPGVQTPAPLRGSYLERGENALRRGANSFAVSAGKQLDSLTAAVQARARQALGAATGGLSTAGRLGQRALDQVPEPVKAGALRVRDQAAAEFRYVSVAASKGVAALGAVSARAKDGLGRMIEKLKGFESLQGIGTGAKALGVAGLATGAGLVANGFAGTVEMERFSRELTVLSRELAGSFKPLIGLFTQGAMGTRKFLERQGPAEQDQLALGGLVAAGGLGLGKLGVQGLKRFPMAAVGIKLIDQVNAVREGAVTQFNAARQSGGDLTKDEFERAGVNDLMKIQDPKKRAEEARRQEEKLDADVAKMSEYPGLRGFGKLFRNEADQVFGMRLGIGTKDEKGNPGIGFRQIRQAFEDANLKKGALTRVREDAEGGRKLGDFRKGDEADPDRRQVTLAQAGFGAAGSTYEDLQIDLLKQSIPVDQREKKPEDLLAQILAELQKMNGKQPEKAAVPMQRG